MKIVSPKKKKRARIEVIPLIDIMFFLLATFVLVSVSMTENRGLLVALPKSKTNEARDEDKSQETKESEPLKITISILEDGTFALDKNELPYPDLEQQLRKIVANSPNKKILTLMGDQGSNLQHTVKILDLAKELQIHSVTIRTQTAR
jgi:biopolymer transport protein ExbD